MMRARFQLVLGVLVVLGAVTGSTIAGASPHSYRLHVQGRLSSGAPSLDIDVPWDSNHGGTPFDFTGDACHDLALGRLRWAWATLQRMPEGRTVTIDTGSETIRAWRQAGHLVLEPRHDTRDDHHSRIKIPDYIVNTILEHDGRLTHRDIERLARERGRITLVKVNSDVGGVTVWMDCNDDAVE